MRDFIEDAHNHRDDGYGRAQASERQVLPRRFYENSGVAPVAGGFSVTLDGKPTRTPGATPVVVPVAPLAAAMAAEWAAQGTVIDPATMPLVRLVNAAVEGGPERATAMREEIINFCGNDLLLYRADAPQELVAEQDRHWDAALVALSRHFGVGFQPTIGIIHQPQPAATLARLAGALDAAGHFELAALLAITTLTGSGLLALGLWQHLLTPERAWDAAHVDENHNLRLWGADPEATLRLERRRRDFDAAVQLLAYLSA